MMLLKMLQQHKEVHFRDSSDLRWQLAATVTCVSIHLSVKDATPLTKHNNLTLYNILTGDL